MADNETPPIVVSATPTGDQVEQVVRSVVMVLTAFGALLGFIRAEDLAGLIAYLQSGAAVPAIMAVLAVLTWARGQWMARHRAKQLASIGANPSIPGVVLKGTPNA